MGACHCSGLNSLTICRILPPASVDEAWLQGPSHGPAELCLLANCCQAVPAATTSAAERVCPVLKVCGSSSWLIAFTLCLPYVWRLCQCIRVYRDTGARPQLFNALKYSTAFPVIILSSMKYHVTLGQWNSAYKPLWLLSACLNSGYSYYWDIERDWEISFFSSSSSEAVCLHVALGHVPCACTPCLCNFCKQICIAQSMNTFAPFPL